MLVYSIDSAETKLFDAISNNFIPFVTSFQLDECVSIGIGQVEEQTSESIIRTKKNGGVSYHDKGQIVFCVAFSNNMNGKRVLVETEKSIRESLEQNGIPSYSFKEFRGVYSNRRQICPITFWTEENGNGLVAASLNVSSDIEKQNSICFPCGKPSLEATSIKSLGGSEDLEFWNSVVKEQILTNLNKVYNNQFIGKEI